MLENFIEITQSDNKYYVNSLHSDINVISFNIEYTGYGNIRRIFLTIYFLPTSENYEFVSSNFQTLTNKVNSKIKKLFQELKKNIGLEGAAGITKKAKQDLDFLDSPLKNLCSNNYQVDLKKYFRKGGFEKNKPKKPQSIIYDKIPEKPKKNSYRPRLNFIDIVFGQKDKKIKKSQLKYKQALTIWNSHLLEIQKKNDIIKQENNNNLNEYKKVLEIWEKEKLQFNEKREHENELINSLSELKSTSKKQLIERFYNYVFKDLKIKDFYAPKLKLEYNNGILLIEIDLPNIEDIPNLKEVKYIQSKQELKTTFISNKNQVENYNKLIYSICLFLFKVGLDNNKNNLLNSIAVNGFIESRNKATGLNERNCIITILSDIERISKINFEFVDAQECFKSLKGINSSNLINKVPVQPILNISTEDNRFVEAQNNLSDLNSDYNLALMDWQEFEHLVREIFEKEFSINGGEVKVTQSSRDGGVDAIAFDPDPIRGGKIVIQAKRYTNVVGVSNVRDLYGTVINEGANRGVLITTSDFGSDSHNFVKDKPISLINGQHLLFLLQKYGYNAKIDIEEAKLILKDLKK